MTATVTYLPIAKANSGPSAPDATMIEPVPLVAEWVEHGFVQMNEAQADALTAIDTVAQMCSKAAQASTACHLRMLEMAYANADATFGLWRELMTAQSVAQFVAASAKGVHRQADAASAQLRELSSLAGRLATETAAPISAKLTRALQQAA